MLLQSSNVFLTIVFILIATILLWLMLWLASRLIISKSYASGKKIILLLAALILVLVIPLVGSGAGYVLGLIGNLFKSLRDIIPPEGGGENYVVQLVPIVVFFVFMLILKFIAGMDWRDATWISFIALLLLYCLYSLVPELDFMGSLV